MSKPRIIIADNDINYLIPLQLKFIENFFEEINLEIITDLDYFNEFFSSPQQADILIVSEKLYQISLSRHNIAHIFIMTEQSENSDGDTTTTDRIFKYSSIKEIFSKIVGKSTDVLSSVRPDKAEAEIILVYSAAGGVGKTTVSMGISSVLTKSYKRVLYINASHLQSFGHMLTDSSPIRSSDIYFKLKHTSSDAYSDVRSAIRKEDFYYLPPFRAALISLDINYSVFESIITSAKASKEYDFIVVDADVSFDENKAKLFNIASKVLIITDPSIASLYATDLLASNINCADTDKYLYICNKFSSNDAIPEPAQNFSITDRIDRFENSDLIKASSLYRAESIQRIAYLLF